MSELAHHLDTKTAWISAPNKIEKRKQSNSCPFPTTEKSL